MAGVGPAGRRAAAGGRKAGSTADFARAIAVPLTIPVAVAVSLAVPVPITVAIPVPLAPVTVPAIAPISVATAIAVSAAIAVPVAVSVALAALAASAAPAIPVAIPMVMAIAIIGERRRDEAVRRIDRREAGADEPEREESQGRGDQEKLGRAPVAGRRGGSSRRHRHDYGCSGRKVSYRPLLVTAEAIKSVTGRATA
jgi:hypothetical protein